jgi:hypothetical protein
MTQFAKETKVPIEKTRGEIETLLRRYKADAFMYATNHADGASHIEFIAHGRKIRFSLPMPPANDKSFKYDGRGRQRTPVAQTEAHQQACRQRWRALKLSIQAKLEAVECKIAQFEDEFLANIVDPVTNKTVAEVVRPALAASYSGKPQALMIGYQPKKGDSDAS